jgi:hypothetical protein
MPTLRDPEIKELLKLVKEGVIKLDFGYQQVCDLVPAIKRACQVSFDALCTVLATVSLSHSHVLLMFSRALIIGTISSIGGQSTRD